jgi:hypothetical protein
MSKGSGGAGNLGGAALSGKVRRTIKQAAVNVNLAMLLEHQQWGRTHGYSYAIRHMPEVKIGAKLSLSKEWNDGVRGRKSLSGTSGLSLKAHLQDPTAHETYAHLGPAYLIRGKASREGGNDPGEVLIKGARVVARLKL